MITITENAAKQIRIAAEQGEIKDMYLRIAAKESDEGQIEYGMGFDEKGENDIHVVSENIDVIIYDSHADLLKGTTLDFVELNPGEFQFIFINPNDPNVSASNES